MFFGGIPLSENVLSAINQKKTIDQFYNELEEKYEESNRKVLNVYSNSINHQYGKEMPLSYSNYKPRHHYPSLYMSASRKNKCGISRLLCNSYSRIQRQSNSLLFSNRKQNDKTNNNNNNSNSNNNNVACQKFPRKLNTTNLGRDNFTFQQNVYNLTYNENTDTNIFNHHNDVNGNEILYKQDYINNNGNGNCSASVNKTNNNNNNNNLCDIAVKAICEGEEYHLLLPNINLDNQVKLLKELISDKLYHKYSTNTNNFKIENLSLELDNIILEDTKQLKHYNISHREEITCKVEYSKTQKFGMKRNITLSLEANKDNNDDSDSNDDDFTPILTKEGYQTEPAYNELCRMSEEELKHVEQFKIYNSMGEVMFLEPVNLLGINIDNNCDINKRGITIANAVKGNGLNYNRRCTVYLDENGPAKGKEIQERKNEWLNRIELLNGKVVEYNEIEGKVVYEF